MQQPLLVRRPTAGSVQRTEQAAYGAAIVAAIEAGDADARVVAGGDLNVFPRPDDPFAPATDRTSGVPPSDQLGPLYDQGLHNLWDDLVADVPSAAYSYVFQGQAQTLDPLFVNDALHAELEADRAAHVNAGWPADFAGDGPRGRATTTVPGALRVGRDDRPHRNTRPLSGRRRRVAWQ